jgi:hypothetical protein
MKIFNGVLGYKACLIKEVSLAITAGGGALTWTFLGVFKGH